MITATTASTYIWYTSASYNLKLVMKYRIVTLGLYIIIAYSYILFIRRMPLVDRELLTFPQQFSSPPSWSGSLVVQSYFSVLYGSLLVCISLFLGKLYGLYFFDRQHGYPQAPDCIPWDHVFKLLWCGRLVVILQLTMRGWDVIVISLRKNVHFAQEKPAIISFFLL